MRDMHPRAAELIAELRLQPHPEGGFYREIFRSRTPVTPTDGRGERASLTTIHFLLTSETVSRWHRVSSDEVWNLYEGGPLELIELDVAARQLTRHVLGALDGGASTPVHVVAAGQWQAARSLGDYALMGCTVGPGFDFADFELMSPHGNDAAVVRAEWPHLALFL
jgi:predicted cupin superfamily sugar epimerase